MTEYQKQLFHQIWDMYNDKELDVEEILVVLLFTSAALSTKENIPLTDLIDVLIDNKASIIKELSEQSRNEAEIITNVQRAAAKHKFELRLVKNEELQHD